MKPGRGAEPANNDTNNSEKVSNGVSTKDTNSTADKEKRSNSNQNQ